MKVVPLGKVATIERVTVPPRDITEVDTYVGLENISSDGTFVDVRPMSSGELKSNKFRFDSGHVLFGKLRPYLKKIAAPEFSGICSTDIIPLRPGPDITRRYLLNCLRTPRLVALATNRATGANLPRLSPKALAELPIPLLTLEEQGRITVLLDSADALRAKRTEALDKHASLRQAVLLKIFGDPRINPFNFVTRPLGELAVKFSDGPFGSNLKSEHYVDDGVRVVRLQNIGVGEFLDEDAAFISWDHFEKLRKHTCEPGDVLVGTLGDPNLRACIQPSWLPVAVNKADCVQIRVNPSLATNEWLTGLLNCPATEEMAHRLIHGQTRSRISMGRLRELEVPVPPIEAQHEFAIRMAKIGSLISLVTVSSRSTSQLFAAIEQDLFKGQP